MDFDYRKVFVTNSIFAISDGLYNNNKRPCSLFDVLSSNSGHTNNVSPRNNNVPIHVRSYQMLHVCFFVQIHPSICFSSYEGVCRLIAQNNNHRKSVILYIVITLSVNVSPETQFHPSWVKVINNLLIKSFSQQSHTAWKIQGRKVLYDVLLEKWRRLYQNSWYIHVFRDLSASSLSSQKHLTMKEAMLKKK